MEVGVGFRVGLDLRGSRTAQATTWGLATDQIVLESIPPAMFRVWDLGFRV